jgi:hypothetical protein
VATGRVMGCVMSCGTKMCDMLCDVLCDEKHRAARCEGYRQLDTADAASDANCNVLRLSST